MKTTLQNKLKALEALKNVLAEMNAGMQPDGSVHYSVSKNREIVLEQIGVVSKDIAMHEDEDKPVEQERLNPVLVAAKVSDEEVPF